MLVSSIEPAGRPFSRFFPIQSFRQLVSWGIAASIGTALVALTILVLDGPGSLPWTLIGGVMGAGAMLQFAAPRRFTVALDEADSLSAVLHEVTARLAAHGYHPAGPAFAGHTRYATRQPAWLRWQENELAVDCHERVLRLCGPSFAIGRVHAGLMAMQQRD
jgi:hypothetical protein